jgi:hypothetical protein
LILNIDKILIHYCAEIAITPHYYCIDIAIFFAIIDIAAILADADAIDYAADITPLMIDAARFLSMPPLAEYYAITPPP